MKIGFIDSGIGGLTVLTDALRILEDNKKDNTYIYFGDDDNAPYGTKDPEFIINRMISITEFMLEKHVDAIIIACNTATSVAAKVLRSMYTSVPIIGMEPAIKPATEYEDKGKILVMATDITLKQDKLNNLISVLGAGDRVIKKPMPRLVEYAEAEMFNKQTVVKYFDEVLNDIAYVEVSSVVLGCTHFLLFKDILKEYIPNNIKIFDGNEGTIRLLADKLGQQIKDAPVNDLCLDNIEFYRTGSLIDKETDKYSFYINIINKFKGLRNV